MNPEIMKAMGFEKELDRAQKGLCPFCNEPINYPAEFRD